MALVPPVLLPIQVFSNVPGKTAVKGPRTTCVGDWDGVLGSCFLSGQAPAVENIQGMTQREEVLSLPLPFKQIILKMVENSAKFPNYPSKLLSVYKAIETIWCSFCYNDKLKNYQ